MLYSVVAYGFYHDVAHLRRNEKNLETHNNLQKKVKTFSESNTLKENPRLLMCIKQ